MLRTKQMMIFPIVTFILLFLGANALWSGSGGLAQDDADAEATAAQATIEAQQTEIAVLKTQVAGGPGPSEANCPGESAICAMLGYVPDILGRAARPSIIVEYGNVAAQLDALGVSTSGKDESDGTDPWRAATLAVPIFSVGRNHWSDWPEEIFGFRIMDIQESLVVGDPPNQIIVLRGRFDSKRVTDAWTASGYTRYSVGGAAAWSIRGDYESDLMWAANFVSSSMNYATILDDGVLAFTSNAAAMADVIGAASDAIPSLADRLDLGVLLGSVESTLAGAYVVKGAHVGSAAELIVVGWTPGGPILDTHDGGTPYPIPPDAPISGVQIELLYADGSDTGAIAAHINEQLATMMSRLHPNHSYADLFPLRSVSAVPGRPIVMVVLQREDGLAGRLITAMLFDRDLGFLV